MPMKPSMRGKRRGTMIHQIYSGKDMGEPPRKQFRLMSRQRKAVRAQPIYSKNSKQS